jgi:hypothetical protein
MVVEPDLFEQEETEQTEVFSVVSVLSRSFLGYPGVLDFHFRNTILRAVPSPWFRRATELWCRTSPLPHGI